MYSVIYGVVIAPFPHKDADNLVSIAIRNPEQRGWRTSYTVDEFVEIARRTPLDYRPRHRIESHTAAALALRRNSG